MIYKLYGDGIHDDAPAIQEMLDSGESFVELKNPENYYLIGKTLRIHSYQTLKLGSTTIIRLMDNVNSPIIINDRKDGYEYITIDGGIWDLNNKNQLPNPWVKVLREEKHLYTIQNQLKRFTDDVYNGEWYLGVGMQFKGIRKFVLRNCTLKDPVTYSVQACYLKDFTIENIYFDFNDGNPGKYNMDGIHLDGGCTNGYIKNLMGTTYDDLLALNANDSAHGTIENIIVDGIIAQKAHSAVRILSTKDMVKNITVQNVCGSFYRYAIGITHFFEMQTNEKCFDNITLKDINVSCSQFPFKPDRTENEFSMIWVDDSLKIGNLHISNVNIDRGEMTSRALYISPNTEIENLVITDCCQAEKREFITNDGTVKRLVRNNVI